MTVRLSNLASLILAALPVIAIVGVAQMEAAARAFGA
ncbi:MAG: hypothetical protein K0R83_72 [Caulobacter sp.]|jgi:hypothetical protein|nr:hypothetical protein [Caulobacter sp.]